MREKGNIDPTFRALGSRARYQMLQLLIINMGNFGAVYQLLDNIFIGREVTGHRCAAPRDNSVMAATLQHVDWNSSHVTYGKCEITVSKDNLSSHSQEYPCLFGHDYDYQRELSFRTEFDLVCDQKLLGGLVQTFVIIGQGIGAVLSAMVSDRFGRKRTLVASQMGLLTVGMVIGLSPNYAVLGTFKFIVGCFQQGVLTGMATMSIELFPMEYRSFKTLFGSVLWGIGVSSMVLIAFLLRQFPWRYLQYTLSAISFLICVLQLWYLDESLRWLMANGKKKAALKLIEKAARVNGKDLNTVLKTLQHSEVDNVHTELIPAPEKSHQDSNGTDKVKDVDTETDTDNDLLVATEKSLEQRQAEKLTVLDIFRHKRLFFNALVTWLAWFTCAFSFFALYMMSASLHGNRFLNYFLVGLMEIPPGIILYFLVDRVGRKTTTRLFYTVTGLGLISGGIFRALQDDNSVLATLSVVSAMIGMIGASGLFGSVFFFTPELFPTNMRNQALGMASFAGRLGGMLAPFMTALAEMAAWAPGAIIGSLCFLVVILFRFIPETKGRELPHTIEDIKQWGKEDKRHSKKKNSVQESNSKAI